VLLYCFHCLTVQVFLPLRTSYPQYRACAYQQNNMAPRATGSYTLADFYKLIFSASQCSASCVLYLDGGASVFDRNCIVNQAAYWGRYIHFTGVFTDHHIDSQLTLLEYDTSAVYDDLWQNTSQLSQ
jgi:hypothetical protein